MQIDREQFRKFVAWSMEAAQGFYSEGADRQYVPSLAVLVDNGSGEWAVELCVMPDFDENRFKLLGQLGTKYGSERKQVPAVVLTTEAWMSMQTVAEREAHPENRVQPRDDPNRQEILMVTGMTLDQHSEMMRAQIERDAQGRATLGAIVAWSDFENVILKAFWKGYAMSFMLAGAGRR